MQDGGESIKSYKCSHKKKNILGGSRLRGGSMGKRHVMNVLSVLLVFVQKDNHGATGPDDEHRKQDFRKYK